MLTNMKTAMLTNMKTARSTVTIVTAALAAVAGGSANDEERGGFVIDGSCGHQVASSSTSRCYPSF
jgi:hypothetical protein